MHVLRFIILHLLNPLSIVTTLKRVLFRLILKNRRLDRKWGRRYRKLLQWRGIPVGNDQYEYFLAPGAKLFIPSFDKGVFEDVYVNSFYDAFFTPQEGDTVIDIGAHVGAYSVKAGKRIGSTGTVLAIEPHPTSFGILRHNITANNLRNVVSKNIALGSVEGTMNLSFGDDLKTTSGSINETGREPHGINVECKRLDDLLLEEGISWVDVIKIDTEGMEADILRGATEVLSNGVQKLVIAAYHYPEEVNELSEILRETGFSVTKREGYLYAISRQNIRPPSLHSSMIVAAGASPNQ